METKARIDVLYVSLTMEKLISEILGQLLNIEIESSKTLGHKGASLTFKNKIDLITDTRAMKKEDARKFEDLAAIRNQFLHNLHVDTFEKCFSNLDGKEKNYKKLYSPIDTSNLSNEEILKKCFDAHFLDLNKIIGELFGHIYKKNYDLGVAHGRQEMSDLIIESLNEFRFESSDNEPVYQKIIDRAISKSQIQLS